MKIILLQNLAKIGQKGEIKNVADGYALNFLIPKKLVEAATKEKINRLKNLESKKLREVKGKQKEHKKLTGKLKGIKLVIKAKASEAGKLFAGLSEKNIADELRKQKKIEVEEKLIKMDRHIKETGEYEVEVDFGNNLEVKIKIKVIANS
ncbi:MAG: 50S ribosomal protein L9 [Candidatus Kuenenbacteria bacterium]